MDNYRRKVDDDELQSKCILLTSSCRCLRLFIYLFYSGKERMLNAMAGPRERNCCYNVHYLIHSEQVAIDESILKIEMLRYLFMFRVLRLMLHSSFEMIIQPCKWHKLLVFF